MLQGLEDPRPAEAPDRSPAAIAVSRWRGQERQDAVQLMFTAIARFYDLNNTLLSFGLHHGWKRRAAARVPPIPDGAVLDLGAGTADLSLLLCPRVAPAGRVVAADLNTAMLREGLRKIRRQGLQSRITCLRGNAERLAFRDASFDAIVTGFCARNLGEPARAFTEIHRVLKPGGTFVCLEFSRPARPWLLSLYDWYSFTLLPWIGTSVARDRTGVYQYLPASIRAFPDQEQLCARLREAGFAHVTYENLSGGIVAIHRAIK